MKRVLHIIATPQDLRSRTLQISREFLKTLNHTHPDWAVDELNLAKVTLFSPWINEKNGSTRLAGEKDENPESKRVWAQIEEHIQRFLAADLYLISSPMWNFSVSYMLKQYIDLIVQPKHLFRYTPAGPIGLVNGKKMIIISTRGSDYSLPQYKPFDLQEPFLRKIFGLIGIQDITMIKAEPMDMGDERQKAEIAKAQILASEVAKHL